MSTNRLQSLEYMRGIAMLGVIGIHIGSQYLINPAGNIHLIAVLEIASRFSVPIFFFISAFGLFYGRDLNKPLDYQGFIRRRFHSVMLPYLVWSTLYLAHYIILYRDFGQLAVLNLIKLYWFGLCSYHLYFMVILIWFYLLMPLWIKMLRHMTLRRLLLLLPLQIAFNYYSCYYLKANTQFALLNAFIEYRLNYLVLHYLFVFILGGYAAIHYRRFHKLMTSRRPAVTTGFILSLIAMLGHYYYLIYHSGYSAESAINTVQQLSPAGIIYTTAACCFFYSLFAVTKLPAAVHRLLQTLGGNSYFVYLFHPLAIHYLYIALTSGLWLIMTAPVIIVFYLLTVFTSLAAAKIVNRCPRCGKWLLGRTQK